MRYKGPDEAYAVNEIYLKLKEEILRQKARNISARGGSSGMPGGSASGTSRGGRSSSRAVRSTLDPRLQELMQKPNLTPKEMIERDKLMREQIEQNKAKEAAMAVQHAARAEKNRKRRKVRRIVLLSILGTLLILIASCTANAVIKRSRGDWYAASPDPVYFRYYTEDSLGTSVWEWWKYSDGEWSYFTQTAGDVSPTLDIDARKDHYPTRQRVERAYHISIPPVRESHAYLAMYPVKPKSAYYYANDRLWYYANDKYGYQYGRDRDGWYYYDEEDTNWHYYAHYDDSEELPDELFYDNKDYELTSDYKKLESDYAYVFPAGFVWEDLTDFKDTDYYEDIKWSEDRHYEDNRSSNNYSDNDNDYDYDSDYDWDDDYDWDSNDYDWDSDW